MGGGDQGRPVGLLTRFLHRLRRLARLNRIDLRLLLSGAVQDVIQVKFNGILLSGPTRGDDGWWIFSLTPRHFALGPNLVSVRAPGSPDSIVIEKLEVQVDYQD